MADTVLEGLPNYFEPIKLLGEGGMGVVWSVRDVRVNKVGALKVIRQKAEMSKNSLTRFEREIRNFAQLIHPYIVQVYDVGQLETGEPYIFMEQVEGKPINSKMLMNRPFSEIMMLIDRILEGLDEAHANNLIHRDLKPDNILVTEDSEGRLMPKLMDFGLALRADENELRITYDGMVVGTPIYMAPEQACDEHYQICPATDFYGIGCILYELFTGEPPFTGTNAVMVMVAQAKEKPKPFKPLPEFSEASRLASIIHRLLEKMPDRRYETAADLRAALRRQFLIRDEQLFGTMALKNRDTDTAFDERKDENTPFISTALAPKTYKSILPDLGHCNYNYSVLSLRSPYYVGRSSAKYLLNHYLRDVFQCRRTALTMITGKPGVGKTRFLESFTQDCYKKGTAASLLVDASVCEDLQFAIFRALFAKLLLKTLTKQQVTLALCRFMQTEDETDSRVTALESIFTAELENVEPSTNKMNLVFCDIFAKLTRSRPLVLCFDNVQPQQHKALAEITKEITQHPLIKMPILICIVNSTINGMPTDLELTLGNESTIWLRKSIVIDPLSNTDMHLLITQSLGISEELSGFIANMSSGMPQIAVTLARQWQLAGLLRPTEKGYVSVQPIDSLPIPRVVHEAILKQLKLTFAEYPKNSWHAVAAIAAFFGEDFTPKLLAQAIGFLPNAQKLISHNTFIALALASGVLKTLDESTLAFANPLMRDAIAASLQDYEIQDYHWAIAQAIREQSSSIKNELAIAQHLTAANQYYEAYHSYYTLAKQYYLCGEFENSKLNVEKARDCIKQHLGAVDARTPEIADLWFIESAICIEQNDYDSAVQYLQWLDYSCQFLPDPEKKAQRYILQARLALLDNEEANAIQALNVAINILNQIPDPLTREQLEVKFSALMLQFQFDASIGQMFIDTAKALKNPIFVGQALLALAGQIVGTGDVERCKRVLNMAIDISHKNSDTKTEAAALHLMAEIHRNAPEIRLQTLYDAMRAYEKIGDFKILAQIHAELADLLEPTDPDEARIHAHWGALLDS